MSRHEGAFIPTEDIIQKKTDLEDDSVDLGRRNFLKAAALVGASAALTTLAGCVPESLNGNSGENGTTSLFDGELLKLDGLETREEHTLTFKVPPRSVEVLNFTELTVNPDALKDYISYYLLISESTWDFDYDGVPGAHINYSVVPEFGENPAKTKVLIVPKGIDPRPDIFSGSEHAYTIFSPNSSEMLTVIPVDPDISREDAAVQAHNGMLTEIGQLTLGVQPHIEYTNETEAKAFISGLLGANPGDEVRLLGKEVLCNSLSTAVKNHDLIGESASAVKISDIVVQDPVKGVDISLIDIPQVFYDHMPPSNTGPIFR